MIETIPTIILSCADIAAGSTTYIDAILAGNFFDFLTCPWINSTGTRLAPLLFLFGICLYITVVSNSPIPTAIFILVAGIAILGDVRFSLANQLTYLVLLVLVAGAMFTILKYFSRER